MGLEGGNVFTTLLKPSNFSPLLALIGIIFYMFLKNDKKKETGLILLGALAGMLLTVIIQSSSASTGILHS